MRPNAENAEYAIGSHPQAISDDACRRLWGAVVEQVISDACDPLPSGLVYSSDRYEAARERAAATLEARSMILDPARAQEIEALCDFAGLTDIPACILTRIRIAAAADLERAERAGWRLIAENLAVFGDRMSPAATRMANFAA